MANVYMYVVARDFGFAPNPFHGVCSLATCKPAIRRKAQIGDWIVGMAGTKLKAAGRGVFAMKVTDAMTFSEYWSDPAFLDKRPVRNGSGKMMNGDNIYHRSAGTKRWVQADSHHSNPDGSPDPHNIRRDTSVDRVLLSRHFFYFGREAPVVPVNLLTRIGFTNSIGHRVYELGRCKALIEWFHDIGDVNEVAGDPFQFEQCSMRYSAKVDKIVC